MSKLSLDRLTSSFGFQAAFNSVLESIEQEFSEKVLYRDNPMGTNNVMNNDIDMGEHDILNVGKVAASDFTINGVDITQSLEEALAEVAAYPAEAKGYRDEAEGFRNDAEGFASSAALSEHNAALSASQAFAWKEDAEAAAISASSSAELAETTVDSLSASGGADLVGFLQAGTEATARTAQDKGRDIVSVKDFSTPAQAVAAAYGLGSSLYWPGSDYTVTGNIANFWDVQHCGEGRIVRSGVTVRVSPNKGETINLYVDPAGDDSNDGLTSALPIATLQRACDILMSRKDQPAGNWVVNIAAGTYTDGCILSNVRARHYRVRFVGPSAATPTAIIDGTSATTKDGFFFNGCGDVAVENVKIQNFTSDSASAGVEASITNLLRLVNVHVSGCSVGYYIRTNSSYFVTGGTIDSCEKGVLELFGVIRNYETVSSLADGTHISGCTYGVFAKEHCTGHLDWVTIDDCDYGIFFSRSCTANASDSQITNCSVAGIVLRHGSFLVPLRMDLGTGTADANAINWLIDGTSSLTTNENDVQTIFSQQGERQISYSSGVAAHTGTTDETRLVDFGKLMGGAFDVAGRYLRAVVIGVKSGSAGTATLYFDLGGNSAAVALPAAMTGFKAELFVVSRGAGSQFVFAIVNGASADSATARGTRTYALTSDVEMGLDCKLAAAADSITIDAAWLYTTGPVLSDDISFP